MEKNTPITVPALTCLATAFLLSVTLLGGCGLPADNAADPVIDAGTASGAQSQDGSHAVSETQNGAQTDNAGQSFGGKALSQEDSSLLAALQEASEEVKTILEEDPELTEPGHRILQKKMMQFQEEQLSKMNL